MKLSSANVLRSGKREIRAIGDACDLACFVGFSCSNSVPNGTCRGFALMNHQTRQHLNHMLNEDDNKYIESCVKTIQRGCDAETEDVLVKEVLRYIPHQESQHREGFANMLEAARPSRAIEKPEPEIRGGWGFRAMLDGASRGNAVGGYSIEPRDDAKPIPSGLAAMLEAISPKNRTRETLDDKPHVVRGMGFAAMLEGASRGTE